jgi:2,4-dienoyl-CoA reductase (NADPH2)
VAAIPPGKEIFLQFISYMTRQLEKLGVSIHTKTSFNKTFLQNSRPDVIILAPGGKPGKPGIPGINSLKTIRDVDALTEDIDLGPNVLIIGGGGIGTEVADYLAEKGSNITLIEMRSRVAYDMPPHQQYSLFNRLKEKNVRILTSTKAVRFEEDVLIVESPHGIAKESGFSSIVISTGSKNNDELFNQLEGKVEELYLIGEANHPSRLMDVNLEAEEIALKI